MRKITIKFHHPVNGDTDIDNLSPNQLLQVYLMASYMYYQCFESILENHVFDAICKNLLEQYDDITNEHKYLMSRDDLMAGTGYAISEYPTRVIVAANMWAKDSYDNVN